MLHLLGVVGFCDIAALLSVPDFALIGFAAVLIFTA